MKRHRLPFALRLYDVTDMGMAFVTGVALGALAAVPLLLWWLP